MIAPRKKLWSTPPEVIEAAIHHLNLSDKDILFDIGAGDCRFIQECYVSSGACCIGIEIDVQRSAAARQNMIDLGYSDSQCSVITGNALDQDYSSATAVFLYLVPRGLKLILPLLEKIPRRVRVVTYMSPFPSSVAPIQIVKVKTSKHADAEWPLYVYELNSDLK